MLILTFERCLLGVFIIRDLCEILLGFSFLGSRLLCILSVESLKRSFISWIVIDTLCEGVSV